MPWGRYGCSRCSHAYTLAKPNKGSRAQVEPTRHLRVAAGLQRLDDAHIAPVTGAVIMRNADLLTAEAPHQPAGGPLPEELAELAAEALRGHSTKRPVAGRRSSSLPQRSHTMRILPLGATRT